MKRWTMVILCIMLIIAQLSLCTNAVAASDEISFQPELTNQFHYSIDRWLRSAESRATVTMYLSFDYENNAPRGYKIDLDEASFVGESDGYLYVVVKTKTAGKHLLIGYSPNKGVAIANSFEIKEKTSFAILQRLTEAFSDSVYMNEEDEMANALSDYGGSKAKTSGQKTSTGKVSYYNPKGNSTSSNQKQSSQTSSAKSSQSTASKASSSYKLKKFDISFPKFKAVKKYTVDDWYKTSKNRALLTALLEQHYGGLRYKDKSMPLPSSLFGTTYVGQAGSGKSTLFYVLEETDQTNKQILYEYNPSAKTAKYAIIDVPGGNGEQVMKELCGSKYSKNNNDDISEQSFKALDMLLEYTQSLMKGY